MAFLGSAVNRVGWACFGEGHGQLDHRCVVVHNL